jgi:hypothetical protein
VLFRLLPSYLESYLREHMAKRCSKEWQAATTACHIYDQNCGHDMVQEYDMGVAVQVCRCMLDKEAKTDSPAMLGKCPSQSFMDAGTSCMVQSITR